MTYVDGFVFAVSTANKDKFRAFVERTDPVFKEHGALSVVECWGEDIEDGTVTSFPMAVKCRDDETVCFSWILWPSKEVRDTAMKSMMGDERFDHGKNPLPFDGRRVIMGGFEPIYEI